MSGATLRNNGPMTGPGGPARPTLRKHERLTGLQRFRSLMATGRSVREGPLRLVGRRMVLPTAAPAQVAFAVPKRCMRRAVDRNRMKRLLREAYRASKDRWYGELEEKGMQCAWLFIYQGGAPEPLSELKHRLTRALERWMKEHG